MVQCTDAVKESDAKRVDHNGQYGPPPRRRREKDQVSQSEAKEGELVRHTPQPGFLLTAR